MLTQWQTYGMDKRTWLATEVRTGAEGAKMQVLYDLHHRGEGEQGLIMIDGPDDEPAFYHVFKSDRAGEYIGSDAFTVYRRYSLVAQNEPFLIQLDRRLFLGDVDRAKAGKFADDVWLAVRAE